MDDVHELAQAMPHVTVVHGGKGNPVYQVGGKSFVFFRTSRPDAVDPDTGIGIPDHDKEHLFTRFFRSSLATEKAIPGSGLGLVIVKSIVEGHGGTIAIESTVGQGTTVTVSLPVRQLATV